MVWTLAYCNLTNINVNPESLVLTLGNNIKPLKIENINVRSCNERIFFRSCNERHGRTLDMLFTRR